MIKTLLSMSFTGTQAKRAYSLSTAPPCISPRGTPCRPMVNGCDTTTCTTCSNITQPSTSRLFTICYNSAYTNACCYNSQGTLITCPTQ